MVSLSWTGEFGENQAFALLLCSLKLICFYLEMFIHSYSQASAVVK